MWRVARCLVAAMATVASVATLAPAAAGAPAGPLRVVKPLVNGVEAPLGVDDPRPEFSWALESDRRNEQQTAYRVLVATSEEAAEAGEADAWDSGKVDSDRSHNVKYSGEPLTSQRPYFWTVEVWGLESARPTRSPVWTFAMGVTDPSAWNGHWIGAPVELACNDACGAFGDQQGQDGWRALDGPLDGCDQACQQFSGTQGQDGWTYEDGPLPACLQACQQFSDVQGQDGWGFENGPPPLCLQACQQFSGTQGQDDWRYLDGPLPQPLPCHVACQGFSDTQGANDWSYQKTVSGGWANISTYNAFGFGDPPDCCSWLDLTFNGGTADFSGVVGPRFMMPGVGHDTARAWTAPKDGVIDISAAAVAPYDMPPTMTITKNGEAVWGPQPATSAVPVDTSVAGLAVAAGDVIRFQLDATPLISFPASVLWDPDVVYEGDPPPPPPGPPPAVWSDLESFSSGDFAGDGANWHDEGSGNVSRRRMQPAFDRPVARAWIAPHDGSVDVAGHVAKTALHGAGIGGNGAVVQITRDGDVVWGPNVLGPDDTTGLDAAVADVTVATGDMIRFEVANNGFDTFGDVVDWDATVTYDGDLPLPLAPAEWTPISLYSSDDWSADGPAWHDFGGHVAKRRMQPGPEQDVGRRWTAPRDGTIDIGGHVAKTALRGMGVGGNGVSLTITRNGDAVWGPQALAGDDTTGTDAQVADLTVSAGDVIRFQVANNGDANNTNDVVDWDPELTYHGDSPLPPLPAVWSPISLYSTDEWASDGPFWHDSSGYVSQRRLQPGLERDVARTWTAPHDGVVDIGGHVAKTARSGLGVGGDGVVVSITRNGDSIWEPHTLAGDDTAGIDAAVADVSVSAGDVVRFQVANRGSDTNDVVDWAPSVVYEGDPAPLPSGPWTDIEDFHTDTVADDSSFWRDRSGTVSAHYLQPSLEQLVARAWTAPRTGVIGIAGRASKAKSSVVLNNTPAGNGVTLAITKNGEPVWGPRNLAGDDRVGYDTRISYLAVETGDVVRFEVGARGDTEKDTVLWDPNVRYVEDAPVPQPIVGESHNPYLRKTFTVAKPVARAILRATAIGMYEARLNGEPVTADVFAPGWTDFNKRIQYQNYDVTELLHRGKNVVGALLGDGYAVGWLPVGGEYLYAAQPWFSAQLEIEYADGSSTEVVTDGSWRTEPSEIMYSNVFQGEAHTARQEKPGWDVSDYDDSDWGDVVVDDSQRGDAKLDSQVSELVRRHGELKPVSMTEPVPGHFVFDFGQNIAGWLRVKAKGPAGTDITMRHAEVTNPDGTLYTNNLRQARATDVFTLAGTGGTEVFEPHFTYHGFQYAEITGFPGRPTLDSVRAVIAHADVPDRSSLETSDELVNDIEDAIEWTTLNDTWSYLTDCHQRDERLPWISVDLVGFAPALTQISNNDAYLEDWMRAMTDAQRPSGALPDMAMGIPYGPEGTGGATELAVVLPYEMWQEYGNTRVISDNWDMIMRFMEWVESISPGAVSGLGAPIGDWLSPPGSEQPPGDLMMQSFLSYTARLTARMAEAIGKPEVSAHYQQLADDAKRVFNESHVHPDGTVGNNSQAAYVLALSHDMLPADLRAKAAEHLVANIRSRGTHLTTGFTTTPALLEVLTATGHTDVAYDLMQQTTYPSWGYMIESGATTLWEHWNSINPDGTFLDVDGNEVPRMNSFNHIGFTGVAKWMYETVGGISRDPASPGFKHFDIKPIPGGELTHAESSRTTSYGTIVSNWRKAGARFTLHAEIPVNTTATVHVPATDRQQVTIEQDGARFLRIEDGHAVYEVGSGAYDFSSAPLPAPPLATTGAATAVTASTATLTGSVDRQGAATTYRFEYGATTAYGSRAPASDPSVSDGSGHQAVSAQLTDLMPDTTYHYRLVATNAGGTTLGADRQFKTPPAAGSLRLSDSADVRNGVALVRASCRGARGALCTATVELTMRDRVVRRVNGKRRAVTRMFVIGRATVRVPAGHERVVRISLSARARRALRSGRLKVTATAIRDQRPVGKWTIRLKTR